MSLKHFGTDGIRGQYGSAVLNDEIAYRAGKAAVRVARERLSASDPLVVVGRDTRVSGVALLKAFAAGVVGEGGTVLDLGVAPTPCVAFAARVSDAVLACSITASHNPACDNGIKFFEGSGVKPSEALEQALDDAVGDVSANGFDAGAEVSLEDGSSLRHRYQEAVIAAFPPKLLVGKRVAMDCANGAMSEIAPAVFRELGADLVVVADQPDGTNINAGVGSECPESLGALYSVGDYDYGFAFDGDGDRLVMFDERGEKIAGEALLASLAIDAKDRSELPGDTLVTTVQSNLGLDAALKGRGIKTERTDVGDKHIARLMLRDGYQLGGEESGHLVVGKFAVTGDGLVAAVAMADAVGRSGAGVSSLASVYAAFPQISKAFRIVEKTPLPECPKIAACIEKLDSELGEDGRLLVRYSGTEPKIRLLVEARTDAAVKAAFDELLAAVEADLELV
ncbi:phosphoglucosamine mutase [Pelagicoccus sp. NFK12]|uniref:Phosphoglucosamine mutase n=1 Tax=Pelagicoccus enzymogenes TaxID=2773457 RepID=A0A927FBM7_9BACT|nr:phosphoglucosamine mutase [Pelagicoccus enzymogenes]MBD5780468.1 phosphoglucosamine mutase [Pelagicoccus enzymogenes]